MNLFGVADIEFRRVQRASMLEAALSEVSRLIATNPGISAHDLLRLLRHEADEATDSVRPLVTTY